MQLKKHKPALTFERRKRCPVLFSLFFCLLFSLSTLPVFPREVGGRFISITTEDGLSHNNVYSITQDREGYIWLGTQDGLCKYDGSNFKIFRHDPRDPGSLSNSNFGIVIEAADGNFWFATWGGGLDKYAPETGKCTHYRHSREDPSTLVGNHITSLFQDSKGLLWIGTPFSGVDCFDPITETFRHFSHQKGLNSISDNQIRDMCEDPHGNIWIGMYGGGVSKWDRRSGIFSHFKHDPNNPNSISHDYVNTIFPDGKGNLWIGTRGGGLNTLNIESGRVTRFLEKSADSTDNTSREAAEENAPGGRDINYIFEDSLKRIWIGTYSNGLDCYDPETGRLTRFRNYEKDFFSLTHNRVEVIFEDRSGILWIGTKGGGVSRLDLKESRFKHYRFDLADSRGTNSTVAAIIEEKDGSILLGTDGGGVFRTTATGEILKNYKPDPSVYKLLGDRRVWALLEDRAENLWVGTVFGLKLLDRQSARFTRVTTGTGRSAELGYIPVSSLMEDDDGSIWAGTSNGVFQVMPEIAAHAADAARPPGMYGFRIRHYTVTDEPGGPAFSVWCLYRVANGGIFAGTNAGLYVFDKQTDSFTGFFHDPEDNRSISNDNVLTFHQDHAGRLWIGTFAGLNRFDRETRVFHRYFIGDGLPNNTINGILETPEGQLWISTNSGLCKFDPDPGTFRNYDVQDGLLSNDFNIGSCMQKSSGEMFFGGTRGMISFFPHKVTDNPNVPPIVIASFRIRGKEIPFEVAMREGKSIRLRYAENSFSFQFAALEFTNPGKNRYAHMLENFSSEWIQCGNRRYADYTNIPPGNYILRVIGSNNDGIWNREGAALKITIIPPLWQTLWFRLIMGTIILLVVFLLYKLRMSSVKRRQENLEALVIRRTRELKVANEIAQREREAAEIANRSKSEFLARMSHEIRTPMNSVIGFNEMLQDTELTPEQADYVKTIHRSGDILLNLINEILDFSRIEAGQLTLESIVFDPEVLAYDVCEMISPRMGDRPVEILCRIGDHVPAFVKGDPGRFRQVLLNLMGNAAKFTSKGEIELELNADDSPDSPDSSWKPGQVKLHVKVRDTGIGIPTDKQDGIFDVFRQADGSTTRKYGGSGLGLSICKQIAQLMGGDVTVESRAGKGSTFHFISVLEKAAGRPAKAIVHQLPGKRILIVDDNKNNLDILQHLLKIAGMKVTALGEGGKTLEALRKAHRTHASFDICILDIAMPEISGYDVAEKIRNSGQPFADIPLLAFSSTNVGRARRIADSGFNGFLAKPVHRKKLLDMLGRLLHKDYEQKETDASLQKTFITRHSLAEDAKHSIHFLMAEDNPVNRKLARFMLTKAGYQLDLAENGQQALDMLLQAPQKYNLIFMDVQMPVMNGMAATRAIRDKGFNDIPIIAITARTMKGDREKCIEAGMNDFISKPIKREVVFKMVRKWCLKKKVANSGDTHPGKG
ncbi:MAG: response regulator [bacterium]|nr:response regulator [bacterium]